LYRAAIVNCWIVCVSRMLGFQKQVVVQTIIEPL